MGLQDAGSTRLWNYGIAVLWDRRFAGWQVGGPAGLKDGGPGVP